MSRLTPRPHSVNRNGARRADHQQAGNARICREQPEAHKYLEPQGVQPVVKEVSLRENIRLILKQE